MPDKEAHLDAVQAYAAWLQCSHITSGYVFRRMLSGDRVSPANKPVVGLIADFYWFLPFSFLSTVC